MPKVKTCKDVYDGMVFEAHLNVDSKGVFSITRPGTDEDWPGLAMKISGALAAEVEQEWREAARELSARSKTERKVLAIRFDSTLRKGGKKDSFVGHEAMLFLECAVALETTITRGEAIARSYREHPDYSGLHSPEQPFPAMMRLDESDLRFRFKHCIIVEWSQELQDVLVKACEGVQAVVDMLDGALSTPDSLRMAASSGLKFLPAPHKDQEETSPAGSGTNPIVPNQP